MPQKQRKGSLADKRTRSVMWMLAPFILGSIFLYVIPSMVSFAMAFTRFDALTPAQWVGLDNFTLLFSDRFFANSMKNSFYYIALSVPLRIGAALALALFLHRRRKGVGTARVAVFLPTVIPDAAFAMIGLWVFNPLYGPLNMALSKVGVMPPAWLVDPAYAKLAFVIMSVFQIGEAFVILLAARSEMATEWFEAAEIMGCSPWKSFRTIIWPVIMPWLVLLVVRDLMMSFVTTFTQSHLMTQGDPYYATMFASLFAYEEAFDRFHFGLASAVMVLVFLGGLVLISLVALAARRNLNAV